MPSILTADIKRFMFEEMSMHNWSKLILYKPEYFEMMEKYIKSEFIRDFDWDYFFKMYGKLPVPELIKQKGYANEN